MSVTTPTTPRFANLTQFFACPEELATVTELCAIGPWKESQFRYWMYESERNGLESALVRPNARRVFVHSARFRQWLEDRTAAVRRERELEGVGD